MSLTEVSKPCAPAVREAVAAWRATPEAKGGYGQAASILTAKGIRTPQGGRWTRAAVRSVIQRYRAQSREATA